MKAKILLDVMKDIDPETEVVVYDGDDIYEVEYAEITDKDGNKKKLLRLMY